MRTLRRICVFCGSATGASPAFAEAARALGRAVSYTHLTLPTIYSV